MLLKALRLDCIQSLFSDGMQSNLRALKTAERLVRSQQQKIVGAMPKLGNPPADLTKTYYSQDEVAKMNQSDYNTIMDKVEAGEVRITT